MHVANMVRVVKFGKDHQSMEVLLKSIYMYMYM